MPAGDKKKQNLCMECNNELKLFELDIQKATKILHCPDCLLFYLYKKDLLGGWKLQKVSRDPSRLTKKK